MTENKEFIITFCIAASIPIIYIIIYLLKGKERSIGNFFGVLANSLSLFFAAVVPILIVVAGGANMEEGDFVATCIIDVLAAIFSIPFFAGLVKNIERDFDVFIGFGQKTTNLITAIVISTFLLVALIGATAGFISGDVSIDAVIAMLLMFVTAISIFIISRI